MMANFLAGNLTFIKNIIVNPVATKPHLAATTLLDTCSVTSVSLPKARQDPCFLDGYLPLSSLGPPLSWSGVQKLLYEATIARTPGI
jgi:hypothetical protein